MKDVTLKPRISEKAYQMSQVEGVKTYVFDVPADANKITVARAVTSQFDVEVTAVRMLINKGKRKQSYRKGLRPINGQRSDIKKAYVTLAEGAELPLFVEENNEAEKADQQAKADRKAARAEKKASKETK